MFTIVIVAASAAVGAIGALALKYGPEDRPGFNERTPLA